LEALLPLAVPQPEVVAQEAQQPEVVAQAALRPAVVLQVERV
jgi:hypothetical protein